VITTFLTKCFYNHPKYPDMFIEVLFVREMKECFELKCYFRLKTTGERVRFEANLFVDKKNLKFWEYGIHGKS
jgi:hypothetical protein